MPQVELSEEKQVVPAEASPQTPAQILCQIVQKPLAMNDYQHVQRITTLPGYAPSLPRH
jgi:hypothetical protein